MADARTATARDFDQAAHRLANAFWFWLIVGIVVWFVARWWAVLPGLIALYSVVQSVGATHAANQLRRGTFRIPNPNNGAPDGDAANLPQPYHSVTEYSVIKQDEQAKRDVHTREAEARTRITALEVEAAKKRAGVLVGKYAKVLEQRGLGEPAEFLLSISELPASKEEIRSAIKLLLPTAPKEFVEWLKTGYMYLAHFVPDADAQFAAEHRRQQSRNPSSIPMAERDRYTKLFEQTSVEFQRLLAEIQAFAKEHG